MIESTVTAVDQQVAEVLRWLEAHPGWLLIVDNVDTEDAASEVERLLATLRAGHVLITSRIANWRAGVEPLELHVLAAANATAFLLERTPHRRRAADDPSRPPRLPASWAASPSLNRPGPTSTSCGCRLPSISVAGGRSGPRCPAGTTSD